MFVFLLYQTSSGAIPRTYAELEPTLCKNNITVHDVWNIGQCPRQGIITVMDGGGRLGNKMWSYVSVWAFARLTGLKPYLPKCIKWQMAQIFENLSVPDFEDIGHCSVNFNQKYIEHVNDRGPWDFSNQSITILPKYSRKPALILSCLEDVIQEFKFNRNLIRNAQRILRGFVRNFPAKNYTFIGVHVRRTDYITYIGSKFGDSAASRQFYIKAMNYYEDKYPNCLFIFISDDPAWCYQEFGKLENVYVTSFKEKKINSPALDMTLMAACNHSIIDYGTFGEWGAILAGGETVYCNLTVNAFKGLAAWENWTEMNN
ncbi:unnamed protein product [Ceutorhynchus assimilis]|uniref:L-Fucosyltransferase n=1 Tax=Ceutorhynchus assimilis TaxID=467358 RepID=A0A9N9MP89_9CUCU|nr:unnamed protein product [Ceutorhynchus assimilis]